MTDRDINALNAAAKLMRQGICPWCDKGLITHNRCTCTNGQRDGATCAECDGQNVNPIPAQICPDCKGTGTYPPLSNPSPANAGSPATARIMRNHLSAFSPRSHP